MTRETGARSGRSVLPRMAVLLVLACAALPSLALTPPPPRTAGDPPEQSLDRVMTVISRAFRAEQANVLSALLPAVGKIYISLESVGGGPPGYYGRDQVYFIVNHIFQRIDTVRFDIRQGGSSKAKTKGRTGPIHCIGDWRYRKRDSETLRSRIHFVLSRNGDDWSLVQIREAR